MLFISLFLDNAKVLDLRKISQMLCKTQDAIMMKLTLFNLLSRRFRRHLHRPFRTQRLFPLSPMQKIISCWFFSEYHLMYCERMRFELQWYCLVCSITDQKGHTSLFSITSLGLLKIILASASWYSFVSCNILASWMLPGNQLQHLRIWGYCQLQLECGQCISVSC